MSANAKLVKLFLAIDEARGAVEQAERRFLEAAGWKSTCEMGSMWLWKRGSNPAVYLSTASAIHIAAEELESEPPEKGGAG